MEEEKILIVCGETSGELHALRLLNALKEKSPSLKIWAVAGEKLRRAGAEVFYDIKDLAVFGLVDALKKLPRFWQLKKEIIRKIDAVKPSLLILVDFSGFNLRLARSVSKKIPVLYYISPQVWASRPGRIKAIKKHIHHLIVIFPFEKQFYEKHGVAAHYFGHPLAGEIKPKYCQEEFRYRWHILPHQKIIALLPGSRRSEIKHILPIMLKTAAYIQEKLPDSVFLVAKVATIPWQEYHRHTREYPHLHLIVIEEEVYDCLAHAHFSLICSGTATLEASLLHRPFSAIYKTNLLNYLLYRPLIKTPFICILNIIAKRKVVEEFLQFNASPGRIGRYVVELLKDQRRLRQLETEIKEAVSCLEKNPHALSPIADFISGILKGRKKNSAPYGCALQSAGDQKR